MRVAFSDKLGNARAVLCHIHRYDAEPLRKRRLNLRLHAVDKAKVGLAAVEFRDEDTAHKVLVDEGKARTFQVMQKVIRASAISIHESSSSIHYRIISMVN